MKKRLAILLASSYPDRMRSMVIPTIGNMNDLANDATLYLYCNGSRFTDEEFESVVEKLKSSTTLEVRAFHEKDSSQFFDSEGGFLHLGIRVASSKMSDDEDYLLVLDDDMTFGGKAVADNRSSGEQFRDAIEFLDRHPQCGGVQWTGTLGLKATPPKTYRVFCPNRFDVGMRKGLMLRRIRDERWVESKGLVPNEYLAMVGAGDDQVMMLTRMASGFWFVKQTCGRVMHYHSTKPGEGWNTVKTITGPRGFITLLSEYDDVVVDNKYSHDDPDSRSRECLELGIPNDIKCFTTHRSNTGRAIDFTCGMGHQLLTLT
jgi:hypothetical protein